MQDRVRTRIEPVVGSTELSKPLRLQHVTSYNVNCHGNMDGAVYKTDAAVRVCKELMGFSSVFSEEGHVKDVYSHHGKSNQHQRPSTNMTH